MRRALGLAAALVLVAASMAAAETLVLRSSRIFTGEETVSGAVVVVDGLVASVGAEPVRTPDGARVIDLGDAFVTPGLVDLATRLGLAADPAEGRVPEGSLARASDALGTGDDLREAARTEGITTFVVAPGDRTVIGGRLAAVRATAEGPPARLSFEAPVKASLGPAVSRTRGPTSPWGAAAALREALAGGLDATWLWVACASDQDVRMAVEAAGERSLVVLGAPRSEETATLMFAAGVPAVVGPLDLDDAKETLRAPVTVHRAGVPVAFSSGASGAVALRRTAALAVRAGLSEREALRALTGQAARIAGLSEIGSIVGDGPKPADLVAWSGSPLDLASRPILVVLGGRVLLDEREGVALAPPRPLAAPSATYRGPPGEVPPDDHVPSPPLAIRAGRVWTGTGATIDGGIVIVRDGRIVEVTTDLPEEADVLDLGDAVLLPGLVDAASPLAGAASEQTDEITPRFRVLDLLDVDAPGFRAALLGGVTTVYVPPGTANVFAGRGAVLRTTGRRRVLRPSAELSVTLGRDAYLGNRADLRRRPPPDFTYRTPGTRMGVNRILRWALAGSANEARAASDPRLAELARARREPMRALVRTQRDLRTALRLAAEGNVRWILEDAIAAATIADEIAESGFPVVLGTPPHPTQQGSAAEGAEVRLSVAAALEAAGVPIAFGTRTGGTRVDLRTAAILAHRHGLSRDGALRAVTVEAARVCGVADRVGSITAGRDADLVAFDGDPLDLTSRVVLVIVEGRVVVDRRAAGEDR